MSVTRNSTFDTSRKTMDSTEGSGLTAPGSPDSLVRGIRIAAAVVSALRALGFRPVRNLLRAARREGPIGALTLFGTGVAVGTGVGFLLAPMSGVELRQTLLERIYHGSAAHPAS